MRFLEIHLKAFGLFDDRAPIELPDVGGPGLCVVYGPNEAGKSTALRAIEALLYGIPARSPDAFVHPYPKLRIGARLRFDDGHELGMMRRKKPKDSLYTYDDREVLRSDRLDQLVERVPQALFARFYGIDHPRLVEGSAALLADDGEVGRALFGAGLGVSNLRAVLDGLESEAAALFAPRGSKPRINATIAAYANARKEIDAASLDPKRWAEQAARVEQAEESVRVLEREIEEARREHARCERLRRSLPALVRRAESLRALEAARDVAPLSSDFAQRLEQARSDRRSADETRQRTEARIERETLEREKLDPSPALLAAREQIEDLYQRVGAYQEAIDQLPRRESALAALDQEIEALALAPRHSLDESRIIALRSAVARAGAIQRLANDRAKLDERIERAAEELAEARAERARFEPAPESEGPVGGDPTPLRTALDRALGLGAIDDRVLEGERKRSSLDQELSRLAEGLGLARDEVPTLGPTAFPSHALIDALRERFAEHARRVERAREERDACRAALREVEQARSEIASRGAVPQLEDLTARRAERDERWGRLRREVVEAETPPAAEVARSLADGFEAASVEADAVGDRLRIDAKQVAEQANLELREQRLEGDLEAALERDAELRAAGEALEAEWQGLWADRGLAVGTPEEMRDWRHAFDALCEVLTECRATEQSLARDRAEREAAISALVRGLQVADPRTAGAESAAFERLDEATAIARARLEALAASEADRRRRAEATEQADLRVAKAIRGEAQSARELDAWRLRWDEAVALLDAADRQSPDRAVERLGLMGKLLDKLSARDDLAGRVEAMHANLAGFEADLVKLAESCAIDVSGDPPGPSAQRLHRILREALRQEALRGKTEANLAEAEQELAEAKRRAAASEAAIAELCAEASVSEESEIDEALRRWQAVEASRRALRDAEAELGRVSDGRSIAELEAERHAVDPDGLVARIATLEDEIAQKSALDKRAIEELRSERDALEQMDGSARGAELAEAAESHLAVIRRESERYVQLRMAKQILEQEIDAYRQRNQDPLLTRAGDLFGKLTLGAYPRIVSEVSADGKGLYLMAVSPDGRETPVSGLSAGTRDQLFLAIRLASLEASQRRGERMPLVADDILIEFDDRRSRATLEVLGELARENQIFLFSHHLHVAEMAREFKEDAVVVEL